MGYNDPDAYNQPEKFALEIVFEAEESGLSYEYNMFVVWKDADGLPVDKTGTFYYATDAGCSCPSPFEYYTSLDTLDVVHSKADVINALEEWGGTSSDVQGLYDKLYGP
jgi:hypothetical protein